jgi:UDP-glucose 4-epimerase
MALILVTGGCGYIGSHTIVSLIEHGFDVICIDNLSRGHKKALIGIEKITGKKVLNYEIDICNALALETVFNKHTIDGIIHFAAYKSVPESTENPMLYYKNNLGSLINILEVCEKKQIKNFVFSSSCSVYGNTNKLPVTETTPMQLPECAYAATKQMGEQIVNDYSKATKLNSVLLRYFNPVGAHKSILIGENIIGKPNNLVPAITQTAIGKLPTMHVWGTDYNTVDGSCVRDYIHVSDIADAHVQALLWMQQQKHVINAEVFNLGSGKGISVIQAINSFEKVNKINLPYIKSERRAGDVVEIYANNDKAKTILNWEPKFSLDDMMRTAWEWEKLNNN